LKSHCTILALFFFWACESQNPMQNRLANSSSPYLQQHADNPVDWYPWGEAALQKAREEDKPIIVSIGYSSCHWCHVMAHESFEDSATAAIMNEHFVNIKVDREQRPDIDQIYMDAVQKMGLNGGWPLNVFLTPDQKPFYGGTYFPKAGWQKLLKSVAEAFEKNRDKIEESAEQFANAVGRSELEQFGMDTTLGLLSNDQMGRMYEKLSSRFDKNHGGMSKAPKFPMPSTWQMLATYQHLTKNDKAREHLLFTLDKMAAGGIYDQVGGGFARYSVDGEWHVPHFEKMLYDNAQLMSLYAHGFQISGKPRYEKVMKETLGWLEREMLDPSGGFYAALDADSEGEEGKFYVWTEEEIEKIAGEDAELIKAVYDVQRKGNWEEGKNVLRFVRPLAQIAQSFGIDSARLAEKMTVFEAKALAERSKRVRPGLDDKRIAGWNGLMLTGLCDAYQATRNDKFLKLAQQNAEFLKTLIKEGKLHRFPNDDMEGFLEDYAAVIQGFITYYQTDFDQAYLEAAHALTQRVMEAFYDEKEGYFYFTSDGADDLIARKKEIFDNVIPSSNSMMARNLFYLGTLLYKDEYQKQARRMVSQMTQLILQEPEYLSNWAGLAMEMASSFSEVVILGPKYQQFAVEFHQEYSPNQVLSAAEAPNEEHPMFKMKSLRDGKTTIFVCYNRACKLPVNTIEEAMEQIK